MCHQCATSLYHPYSVLSYIKPLAQFLFFILLKNSEMTTYNNMPINLLIEANDDDDSISTAAPSMGSVLHPEE
jgi:hypothetical protein